LLKNGQSTTKKPPASLGGSCSLSTNLQFSHYGITQKIGLTHIKERDCLDIEGIVLRLSVDVNKSERGGDAAALDEYGFSECDTQLCYLAGGGLAKPDVSRRRWVVTVDTSLKALHLG
jgi:hypothetical protein